MIGEDEDLIYCQEEDIGCTGALVLDHGTGCQPGSDKNHATSEEDQVVKKQWQSFIDTLTGMNAEMDVTMTCEGRTFKAHKLILCANSPYFRVMFASGLSEAQNGIVDLQGIDSDAFEIIMKIMYFGSFPPVDDAVKLKSLLAAAHLLELTYLYEYCCDEYMKKLNHDTYIDIWNTAELYENRKMLDHIPNKLAKMFCLVQKSREFLSLSVPQLCTLVTELGKCEHNPDNVVKSILYWIKHDNESRIQHLMHLFLLVDMSRLSTSYLSAVLMKKDMKKCPDVTSLLMDVAAARLSNLSTQSEGESTKFVVVRKTEPVSFLYYDLQKCSWSVDVKTQTMYLTHFPCVPIEVVTAVVLKDCLYCVNIPSMSRTRNQLIKYTMPNVILADGHYCCDLLETRTSLGLAALADEIYIVGGTGRNGSKLRSVERYNAERNRCFQVTSMINPHCTQGVVTVNNFLYVADVENSKITIERYDPKTTQWCLVISQVTVNIKEELIFTANNLSQSNVASCAGKLYFVQNKKLVAYYPDFNSWKQITTPGVMVVGIGGMSNQKGNAKREYKYLMLLSADNQIYQFDSSDNSIRPTAELQVRDMCYVTLTAF